jgi:HK97 family phage portal protein
VTAETAMRVAAVYASARIISGQCATLPMMIKRRLDAARREDASDTSVWRLFNRRPNAWQKPHQFKRMMTAHVLLRGNAYALKSRNARGEVQALIPLHPDRVQTVQNKDMTVQHIYTRPDGQLVRFAADEVFHLYCLTLNGYSGVTPITYAREAIGEAMAMEAHGSSVFRNGASVSGALSHPQKLSEEAHARLVASMDEFASGGRREGKAIVLEEGMSFEQIGMNAVDAQWIEGRKFSRSEIFMFFGVFPHIVGDAEGNSQLGSSLEQQTQAFVTFSMEDWFTMWEEGITSDCIAERDWGTLYAKINRNAMVKSDLKTRNEAYAKALQWGWKNVDQIRALEDENPREDGRGGIYYDPPNTAGGQAQTESTQ